MHRIGIHLGSIHPIRMNCIVSQIQHYGKFDLWISDNNWKYYFNQLCYECCIKPHDKFNPDTLRGKVEIADLLRFWFASFVSDLLWCDTDLEILSPFEFNKKDHPYHCHSRNEVFDYYYFYVNGCCQFYKDGLAYAIENQDRSIPILKYVHDNNYNSSMYPIPQDTFRHWAFDDENTELHWQKTDLCSSIKYPH